MADMTEVLRIVVDVVAERNAALRERDAARAEVERLRCRVGWLDHLDTAEGRAVHADEALRVHSEQLRAERDALRAQLHADDQRAWEALGKPEGTHDTTNVQRLCAEVERLRGLIREYVQATDGLAVEDSAEAQNRYERAEDALREVARG